MTILFAVAMVILCAGLLGAVYMTMAVNFVARGQNRVDSVPPLGADPTAFMRALHGAAGDSVTTGNNVTLYQNGDAIFPPMLAAIRESRSTVHFSSYIFWSGELADRFATAFCDAAGRGVVVRLVIDSEGSSGLLATSLVHRLREAGCRVAWYRRAQWFDLTNYNRRTHRRLLVVDGTIAFTGGAGIADLWLGNAESPTHWRDTHAGVTGPAVAALQVCFTDGWNECTQELLLHERDYPALAPTGDMPVTAVISTPSGGASAAQRVVAACIAAATHTLRITNAYFVPTPAFVDALCAARARGVDVTVIVPGPHHDKPMVRRASRHTWHTLLAHGVEIHEYQPTMIHAKTLVVDSTVSLVGSINFDPRSFSLNAECGIVIAAPRIGAEMERVFSADVALCRRVDVASLEALPRTTRAADRLLYWVRAQL